MNRHRGYHAKALWQPARERTREERGRHTSGQLILHDTTMDYKGLRSISDLGPLATERRGYLCHNSLAFDPERREVVVC